MMIITTILFILWFVLLIKGADLLVDGAASVAKKMQISEIIIGLTIVALGTSAPELVVNVASSLNGAAWITIGNVIGSNIANILLILWISAMICPLVIKKKLLSREVVFTVIATIFFAIFINDKFINQESIDLVTRSEGIVLLTLVGLYLFYLFSLLSEKRGKESPEEIKTFPLWKSVLFILGWVGGLILGADWIVKGAKFFATQFGMSEKFIGLTIIAIGTSLPELATSAVAAYKKNTDLALGNIIGSNLFNILLILGVSSVITPIPAVEGTNLDLLVLVLATLLIFIFGFGRVGKKWKIGRWEGLFMLLLYFWYMSYAVFQAFS